MPAKKKKTFLIIGTLIIILIAAFLLFGLKAGGIVGPPPKDPAARKAWFSDQIVSMDKKTYILDEKLPSWKELDQLNQSLKSRSYPRYIKAIQTYNTLANLVEVLYFGDTIKDLGVNTQFVHANYWLRNGKFKLWYQDYKKPLNLNQDAAKRALVHNILLARKQGLAVILFPDYYQLENGGMKEHNISSDLESRLETIALELAQIAEKYQVEYLVPSNQIEMIFESNGYPIPETQRRTNAFYASIVPKIKKVYKGKIMYKMGGFGNWTNYDEISLAGADIFGFTGCYNSNRDDLNRITRDIEESAAQANKLSQKYGIPWFNAEFVASSDETFTGPREVTNPPPIEDYYEAGLAAFDKYGQNAIGFTVHSLLTTGKIYDTPAMPIIKKFFTSKP
jgi:hypothetical protein